MKGWIVWCDFEGNLLDFYFYFRRVGMMSGLLMILGFWYRGFLLGENGVRLLMF